MENKPEQYDAGIDQNQGVVGTMARNQERADATDSNDRESGFDPNAVTDQSNVDPDDKEAAEVNGHRSEHPPINDEGAPDTDAVSPDDRTNR